MLIRVRGHIYIYIYIYILIRTESTRAQRTLIRAASSVRGCGGLQQMRLPPRKSDKSENDPSKNHYLSAGTIKNTK